MEQTLARLDGRAANDLRKYNFETGFIKTAEGSVLVSCGETRVIVTAKVDPSLPPFLRDTVKDPSKAQGWITAEYSMLPGSTQERCSRERNKANARSLEIQRLIGRSLRAMVDLKKLPPVTINIDCDVIQADGGTRTASITGAYVAVYKCLEHMQKNGVKIKDDLLMPFANGLPIINQVAAISVGIKDGDVLLDLNYLEDSSAEADANFILTSSGDIVEVQATAEDGVIKQEDFTRMLKLAEKGILELCALQNAAINN
jgi:ribonuclease PH